VLVGRAEVQVGNQDMVIGKMEMDYAGQANGGMSYIGGKGKGRREFQAAVMYNRGMDDMQVGQMDWQIGQRDVYQGQADRQRGELLMQQAMEEMVHGDEAKGRRDMAYAQDMINRGKREDMVGEVEAQIGVQGMAQGQAEMDMAQAMLW
jgi:hypothetical protein